MPVCEQRIRIIIVMNIVCTGKHSCKRRCETDKDENGVKLVHEWW